MWNWNRVHNVEFTWQGLRDFAISGSADSRRRRGLCADIITAVVAVFPVSHHKGCWLGNAGAEAVNAGWLASRSWIDAPLCPRAQPSIPTICPLRFHYGLSKKPWLYHSFGIGLIQIQDKHLVRSVPHTEIWDGCANLKITGRTVIYLQSPEY